MAGDGGLRDALEAVLNEHECAQPDTPTFNRAVLDDLLAAFTAWSLGGLSTELKEKTMSDTKETSAGPSKLANRRGLRVGELIEFLQTQDPDAPVAARCGCGGGWSAPATGAHADSFTAVNVGACVKIGWGEFE